MKFTSMEEYGLRLLVRLANAYDKNLTPTIPELSRAEGLTEANTAKILRVLRMGGLCESARGHTGGYYLTMPPDQIPLNQVLDILGGKLFDNEFCKTYRGTKERCINAPDCSIRSLWKLLQKAIDNAASKITLRDLQTSEKEAEKKLSRLVQ
jgi:Rrf2 family protein